MKWRKIPVVGVVEAGQGIAIKTGPAEWRVSGLVHLVAVLVDGLHFPIATAIDREKVVTSSSAGVGIMRKKLVLLFRAGISGEEISKWPFSDFMVLPFDLLLSISPKLRAVKLHPFLSGIGS